ncbi:hypothetical protein pah_c013o032 [Parachlamydia acanthamoebae str. Hall's coccus]|nr:hypothetical protein pah_c013o032 [Parachlamydia acanthamoebae str. Hall's coccus]
MENFEHRKKKDRKQKDILEKHWVTKFKFKNINLHLAQDCRFV